MCISPITLKKIVVRPVNGRMTTTRDVVPCGKCLECLESRRAFWTFRLQQECKVSTYADFVTLTYNDENIPITDNGNETLKKRDLQLYLKRVRKQCKSLRYYAVGEYGTEKNRPHYHVIMFNVPPSLSSYKWSNEDGEMGFVDHGQVEDASIHYVTGYIINKNEDYLDCEKPFSMMSKGLGKNYLKDATNYHRDHQSTVTISPGGIRGNLPRYYRDRIFSDAEKIKIGQKNRERAIEIADKKGESRIWNEYQAKQINYSKNKKSKKL